MKWFVGFVAFLIGLWAVVFLGYLPSQLVQAQNIVIGETPGDVGLDYDDVSIDVPDENLSLSAWWMPAEDAKSVVLFVHGANANKEDTYFGGLKYYAALVSRGYHVMAIDMRNHGGSDRTEDQRLTFGAEENRDVSAAITMIETLAPGLPVIGSGVSMGGATLIEAAARDDRLSALILVDPLLDNESAMLGGMRVMTGLPDLLLAPVYWSASTFFGLGAEGHSPFNTAQKLALPILLIQDPADPVVLAEFSRSLANTNSHITYHQAPPAPSDHPVMIEAGGWGSHAAAFLIHEDDTMQAVDAFLAAL